MKEKKYKILLSGPIYQIPAPSNTKFFSINEKNLLEPLYAENKKKI